MSVTQTVEVPASHRLVIEVPREIPVGQVILTFTPVSIDQRSDDFVDEHVHTHPCPICAAHIDPATGEEQFNAKTAAALRESMAMVRGEIPSTLRGFKTFEEMWEDLMRDDPDDDIDDE